MKDGINIKAEYVFVNPPIVNEIIAKELAKENRDEFAPTDGAWLAKLGEEIKREADENTATPRKAAKDSPLDRMERDYGYEMTCDDEDCKQWISDDVTADDKGLNVRWQRVLTLCKVNAGRDCWSVTFYHNRKIKFTMQVLCRLSVAKAIAFDALLAWHRKAKTAKIARGEEAAK